MTAAGPFPDRPLDVWRRSGEPVRVLRPELLDPHHDEGDLVVSDPEPLTHRRPQEALREPESSDGAHEVTTTDPAMLAAQVPRSSLFATSSSAPKSAAPRVPAGGSDPTSDGDPDPCELARQLLRNHF